MKSGEGGQELGPAHPSVPVTAGTGVGRASCPKPVAKCPSQPAGGHQSPLSPGDRDGMGDTATLPAVPCPRLG